MARHRLVLVLVGVLAVVWSQPALVAGESLAEIARRERARRERLKKEGESGKTITDEELRQSTRIGRTATDGSTAPAVDPTTEESSEGEGSGEGGEAEEERTSNQQYWKGRVDSAREAVKTAEARVKEAEAAARSGASTSTSYEDVMAAAAEQQQRQEEAAQARSDLEQARRDLADVEAEARRAGGI